MLTNSQVERISKAYELTWAVLGEVEQSAEEPPRQTMFELSAAVGVLQTLLNKNQKEMHAHQPTQRK